MTLLSVQPFGITAPGGGPRILRALLEDPPVNVLSICTGFRPPPPTGEFQEEWLSARPDLGRIESTRLAGFTNALERPLTGRLAGRIAEIGREAGCTVIHTVAHSGDFVAAQRAAQILDVPFILSIHDDLRYVLRKRVDRKLVLRALGEAWRKADCRLVISDALGYEQGRRSGRMPFVVVTDGLRDNLIPPTPLPRGGSGLRVYFAGLFHLAYRRCFNALLEGLEKLSEEDTPRVSLTARSGSIPVRLRPSTIPIRTLPFGSESDVADDLVGMDLLYLPLPFGKRYRDFVRYSLSTKLVTYLGSGLPILYHGPAEGVAYELLAGSKSAITLTSLRPQVIAQHMAEGLEGVERIVCNALDLARRKFRLEEQRSRFWSEIGHVTG